MYVRNDKGTKTVTHNSKSAIQDSKGKHANLTSSENISVNIPHYVEIKKDPTDTRWSHYKGAKDIRGQKSKFGDTEKQLDRHLTKTHD